MGFNVKRLFSLVIFTILSIVFLTTKTYAAQSISISPTSFAPTIKAGQSYSNNFKIDNQGSNSFSSIIYSSPYSVSGEDYTPDFQIIPGSPTPMNWISFSQQNSVLQPGQIDQVNFTVNVPINTPAGGYYAVAFAETRSPSDASKTGVTINQRVGAILYITVPGNIIQKGDLETWTSKFLQYPPLTSAIRIKDSGSLHFKAQYTYYVSDLFGNRQLSIVGEKYLLPHTIRNIPLVWPKTPSFGLFKVNGDVKILGKTEILNTKYVLVMSKAARIYALLVVAIIVAILSIVLILKFSNKNRKYKKR